MKPRLLSSSSGLVSSIITSLVFSLHQAEWRPKGGYAEFTERWGLLLYKVTTFRACDLFLFLFDLISTESNVGMDHFGLFLIYEDSTSNREPVIVSSFTFFYSPQKKSSR